MAGKMISFKLPAGVQIPDGKQMGDTFQAMTTFKLGTDGMVQLCEVDDEPVAGYKDDDSDSPNPDSPDDTTQPMAQSLQDRLMASGQTPQ